MLKSSLQNYELVPPPQDVDDPQAVGARALERLLFAEEGDWEPPGGDDVYTIKLMGLIAFFKIFS